MAVTGPNGFTAAGSGSSWNFTPNADGSYKVVLTVSDEDGGTASAEQTVTVANAAPTATVSGDTTGRQGRAFALGAKAGDAGGDALTYRWTVTGPDGKPVDLTGYETTGTAFTYTPTEVGTYVVTFTATDTSGDSVTKSQAVSVPLTPGATLEDGRLVVVGTDTADKIPATTGLRVSVNGTDTDFTGVAEVYVFGNGGHDDVQVAGGVALPVFAFGGAGNDRLKGGGGNNVLLDGAGDDLLLGGDGRDVMVGGLGADRIAGNAADDVLIAGYAVYDANVVAFAAIRNEWSAGLGFADRVAHLGGTAPGGLNRSAVLRTVGTQPTVFDDDAEDIPTGDTGTDWFLFNATGGTHRDRVMDLSAFEAEFADDLVLSPYVG